MDYGDTGRHCCVARFVEDTARGSAPFVCMPKEAFFVACGVLHERRRYKVGGSSSNNSEAKRRSQNNRHKKHQCISTDVKKTLEKTANTCSLFQVIGSTAFGFIIAMVTVIVETMDPQVGAHQKPG